jgi:hypothetical protein
MTAPEVDAWTTFNDVIIVLAEGIGNLLKLLTEAINNFDLSGLEPVIEGIGITFDIVSESIENFCKQLPHITIYEVTV